MRIVINVDEKLGCDGFERPFTEEEKNVLIKAIGNGTPLPKGRTIDADELLHRITKKCKTPSLSEDTINGLCGATAIIYDMLNESGQDKEV